MTTGKNFVFSWIMGTTSTVALMSDGAQIPFVSAQFTIMENVSPENLGPDGFPSREAMLRERNCMKSINDALRVYMAEFTLDELNEYADDDEVTQTFSDLFTKKYLQQGRKKHVFIQPN